MSEVSLKAIIDKFKERPSLGNEMMSHAELCDRLYLIADWIRDVEGLLVQLQNQVENNSFIVPLMFAKDGKYRVVNVKVTLMEKVENNYIEFGVKQWKKFSGLEEKV